MTLISYDDLACCNFLVMESGSSASANHGASHSARDVILFPSINETHSSNFCCLYDNISLSHDVEYCDWQSTLLQRP